MGFNDKEGLPKERTLVPVIKKLLKAGSSACSPGVKLVVEIVVLLFKNVPVTVKLLVFSNLYHE